MVPVSTVCVHVCFPGSTVGNQYMFVVCTVEGNKNMCGVSRVVTADMLDVLCVGCFMCDRDSARNVRATRQRLRL